MASTRQLMAAFLGQLRRWEDRIKRATYSKEISYQLSPNGDITVTVSWIDKLNKEGAYSRTFTREEIYPHVSAGISQIRKKPCRVAAILIEETLRARGV